MELTPHLRDEVVAGCRRIDRFSVLHNDHRDLLAATLQVDPGRIAVTRAGYRDELFHPQRGSNGPSPDHILYVGKYSAAKGLPWLLDTVERLALDRPGLQLHIAGLGAGPEAAACGCRLVSTDLPGLREQITPALGPVIQVVDLPRLENVDQPVATDLPRFTADLGTALENALDRPPDSPPDLSAFTWKSVFHRIELIWREMVG